MSKWIARCKGNGWDTFDTDWYGPFKSEREAEEEMMARFPKHASEAWMVFTDRLVTPRKMYSEEKT